MTVHDPVSQAAGELLTVPSLGFTTYEGLPVLGSDACALLDALDRLFAGWATEMGGHEVFLPSLIDASDLDSIDYFVNFPHLGLAATGLCVDAEGTCVRPTSDGGMSSEGLLQASMFLPSAACYALYFRLRGTTLKEPAVWTMRAHCYRREDHYEGLQRLLGFRMREIVYLGDAEGAREHLERFRDRISGTLDALGIEYAVEAAQDPFYDKRSSRALLQRLEPVKHEFVAYGQTAIGSVNVHRNFFGERCAIRLAVTDEPIHTSCVAFGLERWVWALATRFDSLEAATRAVTALQ